MAQKYLLTRRQAFLKSPEILLKSSGLLWLFYGSGSDAKMFFEGTAEVR